MCRDPLRESPMIAYFCSPPPRGDGDEVRILDGVCLNVIMKTMPRPRLFDESALREDFLSSSCTLKELASRHNASYSLVSKLASRQNWTKKREEYRKTAFRADIALLTQNL